MKTIFDIILILVMISVMVMLFIGINQLADNSNGQVQDDTNKLRENYHCGEESDSKSGKFHPLLVRKVSATDKIRQRFISNGPSSRKL